MDLAARLGLALGAVHHVVVETREFRSSCLDAAQEGEICLLALTPGYVLLFTVIAPATGQQATYRYHAAAEGGVRFAGAEPVAVHEEPRRPPAELLTAVASVLGGVAALLAIRQ